MPSKKNPTAADAPKKHQHPASAADEFVVVAIGASADGIEAVTDLVKHLPDDTGMGFVLVHHLDPKYQSMPTDLLAKHTKMPVSEVTDGMAVNPNHVYMIPNTAMSIKDHTLHLRPREESRSVHMPVDHFMRSLAEENGNRTVGVVLSGSGTDGTLGMAEIRAQGGVTFAQDDASAKYNSMPCSAAAAGYADYVMPPPQIAKELARISKLAFPRTHVASEAPVLPRETSALSIVLQLLRRTTGVDFTHYRQTTILRRVQRRMLVHKFDQVEEYVRHLQTNPAEIAALYQDMLIKVTSFFRNPQVFDQLKNFVLPAIMKHRTPDSVIRVWTPGCASGEETYSVAMVTLEFLGDTASQVPIQFFGTDVSDLSIAKGRAGIYPENIQGDVSPERLRRFFTKVDGGYRISKSIRDVCIFAQHNLLNDPPFSHMDLICCRNLLIYLEPVLQNKAISLFHYAARPHGYLVLGCSEGLASATSLFAAEDRTFKIFSKKATAIRQTVSFSLNRHSERPESDSPRAAGRPADAISNYLEVQKEFDRRLVTQISPATAFINDELEIVHTRGNISRYLRLAPGRASLSILKMARKGLLMDLRGAINRARKEGVPVTKQDVKVKPIDGNGDGNGNNKAVASRSVRFEVTPIHLDPLRERYFMIVFNDDAPAKPIAKAAKSSRRRHEIEVDEDRLNKLAQELAATKEHLQSVIETDEATNEELQSANEEILSSNEELQSTNEELETAKEELQSANEELSTVNDDITTVNNDLTNLLSSIDIAVIMLAPDVTIRRFTPEAQRILGLIPTDVGRPFVNINPLIQIPNLHELILQVIADAQRVELETTTCDTHPYQLRILPYRTAEGKTDGAVITLVDLSQRKNRRAESA
jgi:two-component system CheB/CheR fusion protein